MKRLFSSKTGPIAALVIAVSITAALMQGADRPAPQVSSLPPSTHRLAVDLLQPDLLLRSNRLADLPRDLVQAPLLGGILTDDLVHYYESHPGRLSLLGTLKRLAYEHDLSLPERLIAQALAAPGEVVMWRDDKGAPARFVLTLDQSLAARLALALGKIALPDPQLSLAATLPSGTTVHALILSPRATWLFATRGARLLVASDPGLLLDRDGALDPAAAATFDQALADGPSPFGVALGLPSADRDQGSASPRHRIVASARYLSFGYQHFFPGLRALRIDRAVAGDWTLDALATPDALAAWRGGTSLWARLPRGQALCATVPVVPASGATVVSALAIPGGEALLADLQPLAALCWGHEGGLFSPLLAMRLTAGQPTRHDPALDTLFDRMVNGGEVVGETVVGESSGPVAAPADGRAWQRRVAHDLGAERDAGQAGHTVSLVRAGDSLLASTDRRSLAPALAVAAHRYPAWGEVAGNGRVPVLVLDGSALRRLLEAETFRVLRADRTPTFHRVARELLVPRLEAVGDLGQIVISLPLSAGGATRRGGDSGRADARWIALDVTRGGAR